MKHKVALITGSASGLGRKTAMELAGQGFHIIINYVKSKEQALQLEKWIEEHYPVKALSVQGDVSRWEDAKSIVDLSLEKMGSIDVLVNNAGPYVHQRKVMTDYDVSEWRYVIDGNLNSVFYLCKMIVPLMRKKQWGRIINLGFDRSQTAPGWMYRSAFAAAKVGLVSLTKTIALEEAANGITANMICPGDIPGPYKEMSIEEARKLGEVRTPVGRVGTGEDIARLISFLCRTDSDLITGSIIEVTGGQDVLNKYKYEE